VALCTECKDRWEASQAAEPESDERTSDDVCSWCAYGGELSCCDSCSRAVCADCFERAGVDPADAAGDGEWNCFACDGAPIATQAESLAAYARSAAAEATADESAEAALQRRLDESFLCEDEHRVALQSLELDHLDAKRSAVREELGADADEADVDSEMAIYIEQWKRRADELQATAMRLREALEDDGVDVLTALRAYDRAGTSAQHGISSSWQAVDVCNEQGELPDSPPVSDDSDDEEEEEGGAGGAAAEQVSASQEANAAASVKLRRRAAKRRKKADKKLKGEKVRTKPCVRVRGVASRSYAAGQRVRQEISGARGRVRRSVVASTEFVIDLRFSRSEVFSTSGALEVQ
jgi:hypothetical protein